MAASALCAAMALLLPLTALRLIFAAPLALALPGYAIAAASFVRRGIGWPQLLLLTLGSSLATLVLGGLVLNYAPGGIRPLSWAVFLVIVVLGGCSVAALRRRGSPADNLTWPRPRITRTEAGLLLGCTLAAAAAFALAFTTFAAQNALGYTALWILPGASKAPGVRVGVTSEEQHTAGYLLRMRLGGGRPDVLRSFSLKPGETRIFPLRVPASSPSGVTASLFRADLPHTVYRRVHGWVSPSLSR